MKNGDDRDGWKTREVIVSVWESGYVVDGVDGFRTSKREMGASPGPRSGSSVPVMTAFREDEQVSAERGAAVAVVVVSRSW